MSRKRNHIPHDVELASALRLYRGADGELWIPHDHAMLMTPDQVISLFQRQHNRLHAHGGPDTHWNIEWMPIMLHRKITAEQDVPRFHKGEHIATSEAIHKARLASKAGDYHTAARILASAPKPGRLKPKKKIASQGFQQGHRPLRSRNTFGARP
jgi:hypothetical protein